MFFIIGWILIILFSVFEITPLGLLFVWGLFNFLFHMIAMFQTNQRLTQFGILYLVIGLLVSIITGLQLFADYNIISILING